MKKEHPLVTIGIPTYNRADSYLIQSLGGALRQTYQNVEIIVSDNFSTDSTESFVASFSSPQIRYFRHRENIGPVSNFNFCLEQAKGDYFLLLHDDDLIDEDFVEACIKAADYKKSFGLIRTGARTIDSQGKVLGEFSNMVGGFSSDGFFRGWFADMTVWYLPSTLFGTNKLREVGGFEARYHTWPEAQAVVQLAVGSARVDVKEVKASFREHAEEITSATKVSTWCDDSATVLDLICQHAENKTVMRSEGRRHFSKVNYGIARRMKSPHERFLGYLIVFKKFGYPPPIFYRFFYKNPTYRKVLRKLGLAGQTIS